MDELLEALSVSLRANGKRLVGPCPVHGGDNTAAFNMYPDGHTTRGNWKCHSKHCETIFKKTLIGFVRGVLSHGKFGWDGQKNTKTVSFKDAVNWLCKFVGQPLVDIKVDYGEVEKRRFTAQVLSLTKTRRDEKGWPRAGVRAKLQIPARYYLSRGYSEEILQKYDVGLCSDPASPMTSRIVVPVFDESYKQVIGFTARSVFDRCETCKLWHAPGSSCPKTTLDIFNASKWRNNPGFAKEAHLYNLWFAKKHVRGTGVIVLVEGPGDVWRLEEAGIRNAVALFGSELNDEQQILLETSGAMCVVVLMDSDTAGREAVEKIRQALSRAYHVHVIEVRTKDVGEMPVEEVRDTIKPIIEQLCRKYKPAS